MQIDSYPYTALPFYSYPTLHLLEGLGKCMMCLLIFLRRIGNLQRHICGIFTLNKTPHYQVQ